MGINILLIVLSYLFGSFPTAYLLGKIFFKKNIYTSGSGNGGATNVLRTFGKIPALVVLLIDFSKGFLALLLSQALDLTDSQFVLLLMVNATLLGHTFPVWTRFKGGKGVAVTAGGISFLFPPAIPFCLAAFILTLSISGYVSLASIAASLTLPLFYGIKQFIDPMDDFILIEGFLTILSILVIIFHKKNILRLFQGQEPKWQERIKHDKEASSREDGD